MIAAGLGHLKLAPAVFWALTPKELAAALGGMAGDAAMGLPTRSEFERLMGQYPDRSPHGDR